MKEENLFELFIEEFEDLIKNFKLLIPKLKKNPNNTDIIKNCRIIFHTIKGNSGVMGLQNVYQYCFRIESLFNQKKGITEQIFKILFLSIETIENYLNELKNGKILDMNNSDVSQLKEYIKNLN